VPCTGTGKGRRRIWEQYGSRPCPIWMLMVGGGSGGKEINNGLKRSMEDSRNKHQSGNAREPHNRVDLELTNGLKRTKAVQERSCGPAVPRREHGGVGQLQEREPREDSDARRSTRAGERTTDAGCGLVARASRRASPSACGPPAAAPPSLRHGNSGLFSLSACGALSCRTAFVAPLFRFPFPLVEAA